MGKLKIFLIVVAVLVAGVVYQKRKLSTRLRPVPEMPVRTFQNIWTKDEIRSLVNMVEGFKEIPSTTADQTAKVQHIGEAMNATADGKCENPVMVLANDGKTCVLPARIDVGLHYLMFGGKDGLKESFESLRSRMLSFNHFSFSNQQDIDNFKKTIPGFNTLFEAEAYKVAQAEICGYPNPIIEPFQLGIIIQIPGQTVPMHYDSPYFFGSGRFDLPVWLLVVMQFSGLYEDIRVRQVQGVAYIHDWSENVDLSTQGGGFFYWPRGGGEDAKVFQARTGAAIICDGSHQVHGTETFKPASPKVSLDQNNDNRLVFMGNGVWSVHINGHSVANYSGEDLRIALVWRSRCFKDEEEMNKYKNSPVLTLDQVLGDLKKDLIKRGRLDANQPAPTGLDLALLLIDEYVRYPAADVLFPWNYCILDKAFPKWSHILSPLLSSVCP